MTNPRIDDETLAAFLDARLSDEERARVIKAIADEPERYAHFFEAAHLIAEDEFAMEEPDESLEAQESAEPEPTPPATVDQDPEVLPFVPKERSPWRKRLLIAVPLLAAAAIAGVMLKTPSQAPDAIALMQGVRLASASGPGSVQSALGASWDQPGWSVVRGGESGTASPGTVARLGARLAQLEFSASAGDSVAYDQSRARARSLLSTIEGSGPLAASLASIAIAASSERATLARQIREVTGQPTPFDVGAWLETTRLAFLSGHDDFVAPGSDAFATLQHLTDALRRAPPDAPWVEIQRHLDAIAIGPSSAAAVRAHVDSAMAAIPR